MNAIRSISVSTNMPRRQLMPLLRRLPAALAGKVDTRVGGTYRATFVQAMFGHIYKAYLVKAKGRADETGLRWEPLAPSTIAQRPITLKDRISKGIGFQIRGLLTPQEDKIWRGIFRSTMLSLLSQMGEDAAKAHAGRTAWAVLKSRGARTKLATLGRRKVDILRVTDRLLNSYEPGAVVGARYYRKKEQIADFEGQKIYLGSAVPYNAALVRRRPIIPSQAAMVRAGWVTKAARAGLQAALPVIADVIRKRGIEL